MILGFVVSAALSAGLMFGLRRHWNMTTPASLIGLLLAAGYAYRIARTVRWKWAVVSVVALGSIVIAVLPADVVGALADHSSVRGAFLLTLCALRRRVIGIGRHQLLALPSPHRKRRRRRRNEPQIRTIADLDRVIHEPGRLMLMALLFAVERSDFLYLQHETGMNKGTLSSHLSRLEEAGYVEVEKTYRGKVPQNAAAPHAGGPQGVRGVSAKSQRSAVAATSGKSRTSIRPEPRPPWRPMRASGHLAAPPAPARCGRRARATSRRSPSCRSPRRIGSPGPWMRPHDRSRCNRCRR